MRIRRDLQGPFIVTIAAGLIGTPLFNYRRLLVILRLLEDFARQNRVIEHAEYRELKEVLGGLYLTHTDPAKEGTIKFMPFWELLNGLIASLERRLKEATCRAI